MESPSKLTDVLNTAAMLGDKCEIQNICNNFCFVIKEDKNEKKNLQNCWMLNKTIWNNYVQNDWSKPAIRMMLQCCAKIHPNKMIRSFAFIKQKVRILCKASKPIPKI